MGKFQEWFGGPANIGSAEAVEDYAIRKVPSHYRWPIPAIVLVLLGNSTAMFFFSFGSDVAYTIGWPRMIVPLLYFFIGSILVGSMTIRIASREGLTMDLMTRGLGFGYMGSAVTSFIYAINYIFYFLFEGSIVTHAIANYFGINVDSFVGTAIFAVLGLFIMALVWRGMSSMKLLQTYGVPIYTLLLIWGIVSLAHHGHIVGPSGWTATSAITATTFWTALNMANGQFVFQGLMATDYGRFAKPNVRYKGGAWAMIGMLIPMFIIIILGPLFAYSVLPSISGPNAHLNASDPGYVFPLVMGLGGVLFAVITQIRINVMNLYSGSLALSNTFSMAFRFTPGRQWWMILVWILGVVFYSFNVLNYMGTFLAVTGILTNSWVFIILADYFICRKLLKLGPGDFVEYRRPYLYSWNPAGNIALLVSVIVGALGVFNVYPGYYGSFLAMIAGPIVHVIVTVATRGKYYFKKYPSDQSSQWSPSNSYLGPRPTEFN